MTMFMTWPQAEDAALRAAYPAIVGEEIEADPHSNGTHFLIGSSRLAPAHYAAIQAAAPSAVFEAVEPEGYS